MADREAIDDLQAAVETLARRYGWDWDDGYGYERWQFSSMGSRYTTLQRSRELPTEEGQEFNETEYQRVAVRISDHATAYCNEDISIVPADQASGDDHTLAQLESLLAAHFVAD